MKVLIIQFYQIGDLTLTTQIPHVIKKHNHEAEIDFLTFSVNKQLLEFNPLIKRVITFNKKDGLLAYIKLIASVRKSKYDVILDFQNTPRSAKISFFSGAKRKITYEGTRRKYAYNEMAPYISGTATDIKMSLPAKLFGDSFEVEPEDKRPRITLSEAWLDKANSIVRNMGFHDSDFIITMAPTHKNSTRRWKAEHFNDLAKYLIDSYNARIILTFGPGEENYIKENFTETETMKIMPSSSLGEFAALIKKAKIHIGNDSAPHHIATAVGTPTFIIIGSTSSGWVFPSKEHTYINKGLNCQPCKKSVCSLSEDIPCLSTLEAKDIISSLERFIKDVIKI